MSKRETISAAALCATLLVCQVAAQSAPATYSNEGAFLAAAGPAMMESFENVPLRTYLHVPLVLADFTIDAASKVAVRNDSGSGAHPTDGVQYVAPGSDDNVQDNDLIMDFDFPITAIGLSAVDWGETAGQIWMTTNAGHDLHIATAPPMLPGGNVIFFGVIDADSPFDRVTVWNNTPGDGVIFDEVYYIPEPATLGLLAAGVVIAAVRRRR